MSCSESSPPWRNRTASPTIPPETDPSSALFSPRDHVSPFHYPATFSPPSQRSSKTGPSECILEHPGLAPASFQALSMGWSFRMQLDELYHGRSRISGKQRKNSSIGNLISKQSLAPSAKPSSSIRQPSHSRARVTKHSGEGDRVATRAIRHSSERGNSAHRTSPSDDACRLHDSHSNPPSPNDSLSISKGSCTSNSPLSHSHSSSKTAISSILNPIPSSEPQAEIINHKPNLDLTTSSTFRSTHSPPSMIARTALLVS